MPYARYKKLLGQVKLSPTPEPVEFRPPSVRSVPAVRGTAPKTLVLPARDRPEE